MTYEAVAADLEAGLTVPVSREVLSDGLTPVSAFATVGGGRGSYLLESVEGGETWARYSFVGIDPDHVARATAGGLEVDGHETPGNPWKTLRSLLGGYRPAHVPPELPRFWGGAVGFVSYDAVRAFEPTVTRRARPLDVPAFELAIGGTVLVFDAVRQTLRAILPTRTRPGVSARSAYDAAVARIDDVLERLGRPVRLRPFAPPRRAGGPLPPSSFDRDAYMAAVRAAKEHIAAGDIIQVVLSQRFEVATAADVLDVYRMLRVLNPSPYMYLLRVGDAAIAGASPETMVRLDRGTLTVRPIAGTRPRGHDATADERLAEELLADAKERAEHVMLVDLARNDVGRISRVGSVRVPLRMVVERYSHVMHIVSSVTGELADGRDAIDVIAATFPAGTLSGAPKVRAMQIIDELEPVTRGIYGGAVGYIGFDGNMDLAIAIRTVVARSGKMLVQAGAGIVEASDPAAEYDETVNKARAALAAIEAAAAPHGDRGGA